MGILSGTVNFIIPFYAYGYSVGTITGKTDDYSTAAFAAFTANFMAHHMQLFTTIRNYTTFYLVTGTTAMLFLFPIFTSLIHKGGDDL